MYRLQLYYTQMINIVSLQQFKNIVSGLCEKNIIFFSGTALKIYCFVLCMYVYRSMCDLNIDIITSTTVYVQPIQNTDTTVMLCFSLSHTLTFKAVRARSDYR